MNLTPESIKAFEGLSDDDKRSLIDEMSDSDASALASAVKAYRGNDTARTVAAAGLGAVEGANLLPLSWLGGAAETLKSQIQGTHPELSIPQKFERGAESWRELSRRAAEDSPIAHGAASIGSTILGPASSSPFGEGAVANIGSAALQGGLQNAGQAESPEELPSKFASGAALNAAVAGGGEAIGAGIGKALDFARPAIRDAAALRAVKATGAIQSDIKNIPKERLLEMGGALLDNAVIPRLGAKSGVQVGAETLKHASGQGMGDILAAADQAGGFDWGGVLKRVGDEFKALDPVAREEARPAFEKAANGIIETAQGGGGFQEANQLKSSIAKLVGNWDPRAPIPTQSKQAIQGIIDDEIEKQIENRLGRGAADTFKQEKVKYGASILAQKGVKRATAQLGNHPFGLTEQLGALGGIGIGFASGHALPAVALPFVAKLAKSRGSAVAAHVLNAVAKSEGKALPQLAGRALPKLPALQKLLSTPEKLGPYAQPLLNAKSPHELATTAYVLQSQNPGFRKLLEDNDNAEPTTGATSSP